MLKVLHIVNSFEAGGAEKTVLYMHNAYLAQGVDSYALSLMNSNVSTLANAYSLNCDTPYKLTTFVRLVSFLKQPRWQSLDIVHTQLFPSQLYTPMACSFACIKAKLVTTEQQSYNRRREAFWGKFLDRFFYDRYEKVTCVSDFTRVTMEKWQPQLRDKLVVIQNGVEFNKYAYPAKPQLKSDEKLIIISMGRLVKQKNYEKMIEAVAKVKGVSFEYWILGTGPLEEKLKGLVGSLNLQDKVKFLGFRQDIPELLNKSDVFLLASLWEGLSLAMVEAMAAGLPVVVSNIPEACEVVCDGSGSGLLVDPQSEEDIAQKLQEILTDKHLREEIGQRARKRAEDFDMKRIIQEYLNLYASIC